MLESRDLKTDWREDDHLRRYLRLTYLPTGQSVEVSIYRSDMKNHELALKWLTEAVEAQQEALRERSNENIRSTQASMAKLYVNNAVAMSVARPSLDLEIDKLIEGWQ